MEEVGEGEGEEGGMDKEERQQLFEQLTEDVMVLMDAGKTGTVRQVVPLLALTSLPLRFRPHPSPTVPPLLPLPSLLSTPFAAPSSTCTSPTSRWTSPLLHPSAWTPLSHHRRRSSAAVTTGMGSLASVFNVTMPSHDSILGASPLMDPCFVVPLSPPLQRTTPHSPSPTAAILSLPRTLNFVLDSDGTDSLFCDASVLLKFPRPLSIDGAGETMTMICTGTSSLPCPASPSGAVTGLYVSSCHHNLLSLPAFQRLCVRALFPAGALYCDLHYHDRHLARFALLLLLASTPFVFPSPHLSIKVPLLPLPPPLVTVDLSPNLLFFSIIALATPNSLLFAA
ncbi:unnamed protein product [Closterium sp. NIES-65]|nr:unnamed protein product [Closterium sp. NIES-65]